MRVYELLANLLILLLSVFGIMRSLEWIIRGNASLKNASEIYVKMSQYIDIQSMGWFLLTASIVLLISIFVRGNTAYTLLIIGGIGAGTANMFYGLLSTESAQLLFTYYSTITIGMYLYILATVGVIGLWKTKMKKD